MCAAGELPVGGSIKEYAEAGHCFGWANDSAGDLLSIVSDDTSSSVWRTAYCSRKSSENSPKPQEFSGGGCKHGWHS